MKKTDFLYFGEDGIKKLPLGESGKFLHCGGFKQLKGANRKLILKAYNIDVIKNCSPILSIIKTAIRLRGKRILTILNGG